MPNGFGGFFAAAFLLRLSLIGSEFISEFGDEMENPGKMIPLVMGLSLAIVVALYTSHRGRRHRRVATRADSRQESRCDGGDHILSLHGLRGFYWRRHYDFLSDIPQRDFRLVYPWSYTGPQQDGWLPPKTRCTVNRHGVPYIYLTVFFLIGITPILTGMSLGLRRYSRQCRRRHLWPVPRIRAFQSGQQAIRRPIETAPFRLPLWATKSLPLLAVIIYGYGIYSSWDFIGNTGWLLLLGYSALSVLIYIQASRTLCR